MKSLKSAINISNLGFIILIYSFLLAFHGCNNNPNPVEKDLQKTGTDSPSSSVTNNKENSTPAPNFSLDSIKTLLKGKWLRSDGTYIIEIFSLSENGKMDAGYFNPNPINVGSSRWAYRDGVILLEIVLKDANYPGSKYNLIYDRNSGFLAGNYFQAVQGIDYDVIFSKKK